jgi:hypothetical protein
VARVVVSPGLPARWIVYHRSDAGPGGHAYALLAIANSGGAAASGAGLVTVSSLDAVSVITGGVAGWGVAADSGCQSAG